MVDALEVVWGVVLVKAGGMASVSHMEVIVSSYELDLLVPHVPS